MVERGFGLEVLGGSIGQQLQLASVLHCGYTGIPVDFHGLSEL